MATDSHFIVSKIIKSGFGFEELFSIKKITNIRS